ncbi:Cwf15/Cwc15 cell cycle control protein-domain-containing protein [Chytriomyces sp. MP71]|nr:Cwf15/Cwc15 cell cycle control protein-domain-containing protein [Chytriomyces sp. MP71]
MRCKWREGGGSLACVWSKTGQKMTTAARPTWLPAVGGGSLKDTGGAPMMQKSSKDLNAHTKMKLRQSGQNAPGEILGRDALKQKLLAAERAAAAAAKGGIVVDDDDDDKQNKDDSDDDDDDSDDDTAELMRELEKIKRERAEDKERQEREKREEEERAKEEAMLAGNPLLNVGSSSSTAVTVTGGFAVKRRWDDDVIFKNQARGVDEKPKKRFINDLLRSDFHRKFMSKYVR